MLLDERTRLEFTEGCFPKVLIEGAALPQTSRLKNLLDRIHKLRGHQETDHFRSLIKKLQREIRRASLYAVQLHEGRRAFENGQVAEKAPEYGRQRFLDGQLYHLDLPSGTEESAESLLMRAATQLAPMCLLGVKPRDNGSSAVFLPSHRFDDGLRKAFGQKIADKVLQEDRLDRLQFLTILAHREGRKAVNDLPIPFPSRVVEEPAFDGLIADLDEVAWQQLIAAFQLPADCSWVQVSILDREQGLATKGALRLCKDEPACYSESWKIGIPSGSIAASCMLIHESDVTYQPKASLNLQQLAYNYSEEEQRRLIDEVFIPNIRSLLDYKWTAQLRGVDRLLAAGAQLRLEPVCKRVNARRKKLALSAIHRAEVPGFRAKAAPDPSLEPYTCRVPKDTFPVGSVVDITRDPSLPLGNSTQRFRVVGESSGYCVELGADPWIQVMGGDFDGDDACVQTTTVQLFPKKDYDRTPVAQFRQAKGRVRRGVEDPLRRFEQAIRVLERPIGIHDITARRLLERGRLDREARMKLSRAIQAAIDSAKHAAEICDPGYGPFEGDHAIDAIRRADLRASCIRASLYAALVTAALDVIDADLTPVSFDPMPIRLADAALSVRFSQETRSKTRQLAEDYSIRFARLCQDGGSEQDIDRLVDRCCVQMEAGARHIPVLDASGASLSSKELCLVAFEISLLRHASLHFASRVVRLQTLELVFDRTAHFVRLALEASSSQYLRKERPNGPALDATSR